MFKEEEQAVQVGVHESCGRLKLYWAMCLADANTLKALIEFRETSKGTDTLSSSSLTQARSQEFVRWSSNFTSQILFALASIGILSTPPKATTMDIILVCIQTGAGVEGGRLGIRGGVHLKST